MTDADVAIFQSIPFLANDWYAAHYDNTPELVLRTDAQGQLLVGRNPFSPDPIFHWWRGSTAVAVVRVTKDGVAKFGFLEARLFNLAYWRGQTTFADHDLTVGAAPCGNRGPTTLEPETWDALVAGPVTLRWRGIASAISYAVHAARPGEQPRTLGETAAEELTVTLPAGSVYWWVEAKFAKCPSQRSDSGRLIVRTPKRRSVR
jgi:hypothetical protein